jgi:magnesium transporter
MFKVIDLPPEGKPVETSGPANVRPPPAGTVRWIDLVGPDPDSLTLLRERFQFHPLALADCAHFQAQSKIEEYDGFLFIVLHTLTASPDDASAVRIHELHAFLTQDTLVTVHDDPLAAHEQTWNRAAADRSALAPGPSWALYVTADVMVDAIFPVIEQIAAELEELEETLLVRRVRRDPLRIFRIKRTLLTMRRVIRPLRDAIATLTRRGDPRIGERAAIYFRDVHDHVIRCAESIEEAIALTSNAMEAYHYAVAQRTNEIIKRLTVMSAIFLPLTFITGFWGQNFAALPFDRESYLWLTLASMVIVPGGLFLWFTRKGWV